MSDIRNGVCLVCGGGVLNSGEHIDPERHTAEVERILAAFGATPHGEDAPVDSPHGMWCPPGCGHDRSEAASLAAHDHEWQRRQNVTSSGYRMPPYEVCAVDGCDAARPVEEPATCDHERAACYLATASTLTCVEARNLIVALTPATLPSVEDVARAILMATQAADVDPDYAWSVQYPEVQDELLDQARAVLALFEKGAPRG